MDLPSKEQALGPCCVVRQVAAELPAALFFWDSLFSRVPFPSEILRRHAEMLCHRRLIRLPEPAMTVPPLQNCLLPRQMSAKLKIRRCLGHPVQGRLHPCPWIGLRGISWPPREQLTLPHSPRLLAVQSELASKRQAPPGPWDRPGGRRRRGAGVLLCVAFPESGRA